MKTLMEAIAKIDEDYYDRNLDVRAATNKIHQQMDEGIIDPRSVAEAALSYMSESEVADMARANDWYGFNGEEDEFDEDVEVIGDPDQPTYSIANDDVELFLTRAAQALAQDAVEQAGGVYDEEGPGEGNFATGAQNRHQYIEIAAKKFLDQEYQKSIMKYLATEFDQAVKNAINDYHENR